MAAPTVTRLMLRPPGLHVQSLGAGTRGTGLAGPPGAPPRGGMQRHEVRRNGGESG